MTPRKFMRSQMRSAFAELKDLYKAYAKQIRKEGGTPKTWRQWLKLDD